MRECARALEAWNGSMTEEQRRCEIDAILKLVNELEALSNYQIAKAHMIRAALEDLRGSSKQVEAVEGGGEGLAREF